MRGWWGMRCINCGRVYYSGDECPECGVREFEWTRQP